MTNLELVQLTKNFTQVEIASIKELGRIIFHENVTCYETEARLTLIPQEHLKLKWDSEIKLHVTLDNKAFLDDFPHNYCYFPELWKNNEGKILLILYKSH